MNRKISIILVFSLLLLVTAAAFAQNDPRAVAREEAISARAEMQMQRIREKEARKLDRERKRQERRRRKSARQKLKLMQKDTSRVNLNLVKEDITENEYKKMSDMSRFRDTIRIKDIDGNDAILMRAVLDTTSGEMVANEMLDAAVVTARFRNVAERHGKINIQFDITVPESMQDTKWQLRIFPEMTIFENTTNLEPLYITGKEFRKAQLRGYERYRLWLQGIISDPLKLIDVEQLEGFLMREIPQLYELKYDEGIVTDEEFSSIYGVTEKDAVAHFTNRFLVARNNRRRAQRGAMFRRYVKAPIDSLGLRLDSVTVNNNGDFVYSYTETIMAQKDLRKVDITLGGSIHEQDKKIYTIPKSDPLTFYIASLASFVDKTPRYLLKVIERHAEANAEYKIQFEAAKADIKEGIGDNAAQIRDIKRDLAHILNNDTFILDSILITSYASPEGSVATNKKYSRLRSEAVSSYFNNYIRHYKDSLKAEKGVVLSLDGGEAFTEEDVDVKFLSFNGGENWYALDQLVEQDQTLSNEDKFDYFSYSGMTDLDQRENKFRSKKYYPHLREHLYPLTRTVKFNFQLHRKGMTKEIMETTVLDSVYMEGVQAIEDRNFEKAVNILRPYQDYNTAVAFTALDYNISAMTILETLPVTAQSEYMMALITSRQGDDQAAVQHYLNSVKLEPQYRHRGNLDPEIKILIDRYSLFKQEEDDNMYQY